MVDQLNELLKSEPFDFLLFESVINELKNTHKMVIRVLDFTEYDEEKKAMAQTEKTIAIKTQNFEAAAKWRDIEHKCNECINLRIQHNMNNSYFLIDHNFLLFLYMGNAPIDKQILQFILNNIKN